MARKAIEERSEPTPTPKGGRAAKKPSTKKPEPKAKPSVKKKTAPARRNAAKTKPCPKCAEAPEGSIFCPFCARKLPKKRVNKGSATNETDAQRLEKKDKILDLTASGASIRQISEILTAQGYEGVSRSSVGELLKEALDDAQQLLDIKGAHYIRGELEKLQRAELAHLPSFLKATDPKSAESLAKALKIVWDRKDRFTGHDKQRHEHTGKDGAPIETTTEVVTRVILPVATETTAAPTETTSEAAKGA